jgi:hypothetical protein
MATLNLCRGCNHNFASSSSHMEHRTGSFAEGSRHCLTEEEMIAKGWTHAVEPVKRRLENKPYVDMLDTWRAPMSESGKAYFAALRDRHIEEDVAETTK